MRAVQPMIGRVGAALFLLLAGLSDCSKFDNFETDSTVNDEVAATDLTARYPAALGQSGQRDAAPGPQVFPGAADDQAARSVTPAAEGVVAREGGQGYDLNFNNAEIAAVAKALLGDLLHLSYAVDPRVQGTITLSSGRSVARSDIMPLLESVLKFSGATLLKEGPVYKIVPGGEDMGGGSAGRFAGGRIEPGHGLSVLPLRHMSAQAMLKALDSFAAKPGMLRIDQPRNLLLVMGTSTERASTIEAALALDVDWMRNQSVGVFPVRNASPETIIAELTNIFDSGREGTAGNLVRFQPVVRLNAVLAVAQTTGVIEQVRTWVARLDRADYDNTTVRVYRIRYGNARVMAGILREVFTGQSAGSVGLPGSADLSQLTPGSSIQRSTSDNSQPSFGSRTMPTPTPSSGDPTGRGTDPMSQSRTGVGQRPEDRLSSLDSGGGSQPPLLANVRITADTANNSLLIYANRDQYKIIEKAIFELDRAPMQVAIDVTIAEITLRNELQFGVQFYIKGKNVSGGVSFGTSDVLAQAFPGGNFILGARQDPRVVINALRAITDVKVLSSPSLVVLDNQQAMLQVGDQVPIQTSQQSAVAGSSIINTVEMRDTGVILRVTPRVNANGAVTLDIIQEISNVVNPGGGNNPNLTPTISQRKIQSSVAVASGQTVLLGGLISARTNQSKTGLPILSELKGIGDLFADNTKTTDRTELILFIRPQIIRDGLDAQLVAEELRSKLNLIGRGTGAKATVQPVVRRKN
ncbi:MAG: type II secretion system protein GspD [Rhizobiales bacterium]|nr:type II secretion system protein GspD [Hyphomicrobiales bacterium]